MSTKRIRGAIEALAACEPGASDGAEQRALVAAALAEVEAIERAAKAMQSDDVRHALRHADDAVMAALATLTSIVKGLPMGGNQPN